VLFRFGELQGAPLPREGHASLKHNHAKMYSYLENDNLVQVALSFILLAGTALLVRSVLRYLNEASERMIREVARRQQFAISGTLECSSRDFGWQFVNRLKC